MKPIHRILAIIVAPLMLFIAATGSLMEILDLGAVAGGAPETDATMQSINEGKFGNGPYNAVIARDFGGDALPAGLDIPHAFATVQAGLARQMPGRDPVAIDLRVDNGRVIGQGQYGKEWRAVDALSGADAAPIDMKPFNPPPSLRQMMKEWHRFWGPSVRIWRGDKPAVYIEFAAGIALCVLIYTGLTYYIRLYRQRRKIKRPNPFWMAGGKWRALHRVIATGSAVFVIVMAVSGMLIGFESTWHTFVPRPPRHETAPLPAAAVQPMLAATLTAFAKGEPGVTMRSIRLRDYYGYRQGVIVTRETVTRQIVYDTATGRAQNLEEPGYPSSQFPFGMDMHEAIKHFHSGYMFGIPARLMALISGFALIYLSISGAWMYFEMWLQRRGSGRPGFFWKG
ncbi:putative iron-regulated membrane protein [Novosphingobium sp. SG751A]|uniref:PepSY-associated TM helix domain-containing protein n=1 Tax=Novosphingobium sp. SG751A TaxID=2587000 RepID=UPI001554B804|nr:PepSY-associated TM helix domain-containing protein [Novosphingobium sp. SG751A]NOW48365.1 putative iron-regulated membrane protein [Novosphingobium sp. SG751A]